MLATIIAWIKKLFTAKVKAELKNDLQELKTDVFKVMHDAASLLEEFAQKPLDELLKHKEISIAGHVLSKKHLGDLATLIISDGKGLSQVQIDLTGELRNVYKNLTVGDIVGVAGKVGKLAGEELVVLSQELKILSKKL